MSNAVPTDMELMELSLLAAAEAGVPLHVQLFERFFAVFPERRSSFLVPDAAAPRMTDETLQIMLGLDGGERWVWPFVSEMVSMHRNYGELPISEFDAFVDMTVDALGLAAGDSWSAECEAAWRRQADSLKRLIVDARQGWAALA
jgi:hypothetical protein